MVEKTRDFDKFFYWFSYFVPNVFTFLIMIGCHNIGFCPLILFLSFLGSQSYVCLFLYHLVNSQGVPAIQT